MRTRARLGFVAPSGDLVTEAEHNSAMSARGSEAHVRSFDDQVREAVTSRLASPLAG